MTSKDEDGITLSSAVGATVADVRSARNKIGDHVNALIRTICAEHQ